MATAALYAQMFDKAFNKEIDLLSDTLKVSLHTSAYTPNLDTHDYFDDATSQVTGTGYTTGGAALGSMTFTYTAGSNLWTFDAADTSWTTSTITARYAVIYDSTPATDATRPLIAYQNFTSDQSSSGGTFLISWNASGIFTITVGAES